VADEEKIINRGYMKKVMLVFGTRPEAIKMAPLVKEFQKQPKRVETVVCVTGQHREMLDQVLKIFDIKPDYDLNIMKQGQDLYDVTARVLTGMRDVLKEVKPDVVLVHGDTTTSTAAALAAFYQQIPVGHVEAGLRTHNIYSPWPEEMNRLLTGRLATYHFSPTPLSRNNLIKESVDDRNIIITGNTVIDALYWVVDKIKNNKELDNELEDILSKAGYDVNRLNNGKKLVLITGHRRENFGDGFINMCTAIKDLTVKYPDLDFVYPMHLNPNVRKPIHKLLYHQSKMILRLQSYYSPYLPVSPFRHLMLLVAPWYHASPIPVYPVPELPLECHRYLSIRCCSSPLDTQNSNTPMVQ
jgi:UDP-N-acetylglucosamine 2-epimerase (non-hydrolysing)